MGSWTGRGDLVVLEKDAQMLYGALGVLTELRDIAAERLRPPVQQPIKGIKQNALRDQQGLGRLGDCGGEPKDQDAKQRQSAMPVSSDTHGKVDHSSCVHIQRAEKRRDQKQQEQISNREQKEREKQFSNVENAKSDSGEQESASGDQRAPFSHGPMSLQIPLVIGCGREGVRNAKLVCSAGISGDGPEIRRYLRSAGGWAK